LRTLLIDGDILAFTVAARAETKIDWGDDSPPTRHANLEEAQAEALRWMREITEVLDADDAIVALSDPPSLLPPRHLPAVQAHRTHGETPLVLFDLKDYLRTDAFKSKTKPDLEADDVLGIYATHPTLIPGEKIIVTADKDLRQIAGKHFNPRKPDLGIYEITPAEADEWFYTQALTGDPTDGFPGCPRIGPVKAAKILRQAHLDWSLKVLPSWLTPEDYVWRAIVAAYEKAGKDVAYALTMARVARILRASDYDFDNQRPILWTPASCSSPASPA
jgi:hypothetical protein